MRHQGNAKFGGSFNHIEIQGINQSSHGYIPNKFNSDIILNMPEIHIISMQIDELHIDHQYAQGIVEN